ncbi:MAG: flagellar basal body rod C-terminal domain-containing protein [Gemmatimonadota bacterium]
MNIAPPAMSSALSGMRYYSDQVDRAAAQIAAAGIDQPQNAGPGAAPGGPPVAAADVPDLGEAMVTMMIAQRAFSAQLRVLQTADQMMGEVVAKK